MLKVSLVVLYASDLEACFGFYEKFGLVFAKEKHGAGPEHYSARVQNIVFELYPGPPEGANSSRTMIGFQVPDPERLIQDLIAAAYCDESRLAAWRSQGFVIVKDPGGNRIMIEKETLSPGSIRR